MTEYDILMTGPRVMKVTLEPGMNVQIIKFLNCDQSVRRVVHSNVTGSSVVELWARYPEVAGSYPAQFQFFIDF